MSYTWTRTFTVAEVSSRVMADLRQLQIFYGRPTMSEIKAYGAELDVLLPDRYVHSLEYGFQRFGQRVVSLLYEARYDGSLTSADNSGAVYRNANIVGASWFSFLSYSDMWWSASAATQQQVLRRLPFQRSDGTGPADGNGVWIEDKRYGSEGMGLVRRTYQSR